MILKTATTFKRHSERRLSLKKSHGASEDAAGARMAASSRGSKLSGCLARRLVFVLGALSMAVCCNLAALAVEQSTAFPENMGVGLTRFVLNNGLVVLLREEHAAPVVSIQIWVGTGSSHEQDRLGAGLSHFIEHMIFKGTPTRGPAEISRAVSDLGGMINAYTSLDRTVFFIDLPAANWVGGLEILADAVQHAAFPEDEWRREQEVILREMAMCRDNPDDEISRLLLETAYRVHPYRVPVIGYEEIFKKLTREDLLAFFNARYVPDNMILSVAGDIDAAQAAEQIRAVFKDFARRPMPLQILPKEPPQISPRRVRRTGAYQVARVEQCWHTVALQHPDAPALDVLAIIVGSGRSARLPARIVERGKLAHSIEAWSFTPVEPGLFGITAVFDPEKESELLAALDDEVQSWQTKPFSAGEIAKARRIAENRVIDQWQTAHGQAHNLASGEFYAGDPLFLQTYLKRLAEVTPTALTDVARRYLSLDARTCALLLPESAASGTAAAASAVKPGAVQKFRLDNGVVLLVREDRRLPLVNVCAALQGGVRFENAENNGITSMMAELLTRGSRRLTAEKIAEIVDEHGGSFTAFAGQNSFGLQTQCRSEDVELFIKLLAEGLLTPSFPEEEIEKRRKVQLALIAQQLESPVFLAQNQLRQMLFPAHPYRFTAEGTPASVARITRETLYEFHARMAVAGNLVVAIFGDIAPERARKLAESAFAAAPAATCPALERGEPLPPALPQVKVQQTPKEQTIVMQGFPGLALDDPDMEALNVIQTILSGLSSDLLINIRDKEGLAYFGGAINRPGVEPGLFAVYAGIHQQALERVRRLMEEELGRLAGGGVRKDELARARAQMISRHLHSLQSNAELAQECALNELYGLGYDYVFALEERLRRLTEADLTKAAARVFRAERAAVSIVTPEAKEERRDDSAKPNE